LGLNRGSAALFRRGLVHAGCVEVANLLRDRIPLIATWSSLLQNAAQERQIVLVELCVNAP